MIELLKIEEESVGIAVGRIGIGIVAFTLIGYGAGLPLKSNSLGIGAEFGNYNESREGAQNFLYIGVKGSYHFYIPNRYGISNELFIKLLQSIQHIPFQQIEIGINWFTNLNSNWNYFFGFNTGILHRHNENGYTFGVQGGALYSFTSKTKLKIGVAWENFYSTPENANGEWGGRILRPFIGIEQIGF
ncbi:MAG: hypothetical protein ABGW77_06005 [Campylobacterales bacterium]